jgi:hypothetical protein
MNTTARPQRGVAALGLVACGACAAVGGDGHDVGPPSPTWHDVRVAESPRDAGAQGYEYVAKRPLGVVALAEARGIDPDVAKAVVDRLADALDTCATEQGRKGALVNGAARVAVQIDDSGNITGTNVRVDPGAGVAENAVLCFVAPVKMLTFPPADAGARGFAVEALWGALIPTR